jgi:hypothetical protein
MAAMTADQKFTRLVDRRKAQIVRNRAGFDALYEGMADGLVELGTRILEDAKGNAHRDAAAAARRGVAMMADTGYVSVWAQGTLVHGFGQVAASQNKPRGVKTPKDQVVVVVAFSSPVAHFNELGTVAMPAQPFLTPALMANVANAGPYVAGAMSRRAARKGA